jgi:hypothetical protein
MPLPVTLPPPVPVTTTPNVEQVKTEPAAAKSEPFVQQEGAARPVNREQPPADQQPASSEKAPGR